MTTQRTEMIKFAVTPEEKEAIYSKADQLDVSVSHFIRSAIENRPMVQQETYKQKNLFWKQASTELSKTALIIYLLLQEEGEIALSPSKVESLGFMAKGTASKAINELRNKGYITDKGELIIKDKEVLSTNNNYSVYKLTFPNGNIYIGITCGCPETRWANGDGYKYNLEMYKAIQHFGWDNIQKEIIYSGLSNFEANSIESNLIKQYSETCELYNKAKLHCV